MEKRQKDRPVFHGMDQEEQQLYEERLFRDSFMEKQEGKHHAFLVTVLALLILFLGMMLFLYLYVFPAADPVQTEQSAANIQWHITI